MKVLFVSPEVLPFAKTGGLADVSGNLPAHLKSCGCDIRVITPFYRVTRQSNLQKKLTINNIQVPVGSKIYSGEIWESLLKSSVPVYLIKCDEFFNRDQLYGTSQGDYPDNAERFIFFCRCAMNLCEKIKFSPDIIHCNDWQTGLIPAYIMSLYKDQPFFLKTATVFTVHNVAYQGLFKKEKFNLTCLPPHFFDINGLEYWGKMNMLKSAVIYSDVINTVSKKYSLEIQTQEYGYGLEDLFSSRKDDLYGILNGVDYDEWNPSQDRFISAPYSIENLSGKTECKKDMLNEFNLSLNMIDSPIIGCISRLAEQKGFDLLMEVINKVMELNMGFILLGTGEDRYQKFFRSIGVKYPGRAGIVIVYDEALAHKIEAGCDMFLMPSRYEPCGLNQMYSLKYGTVPIVRATGGLDDTIQDYDITSSQGNGFVFHEYSSMQLLHSIKRALHVYRDKQRWRNLMIHCMSFDFSWHKSAQKYIKLYHIALKNRAR